MLRARAIQAKRHANLTRDRESPMDLADQVHLLDQHGVLPDVVLMDDGSERTPPTGVEVVRASIAGRGGRAHDPVLLGAALASCHGNM